jgi:Ni/Co efflux regulator RcnB
MKHLKTVVAALLITALPMTPAAFASERGHDDHGDRHERDHDNHGQRWHHYQHRHDNHRDHRDHDDHYRDGHGYSYRTGVVLSLPAFPVIVINKTTLAAPIERHQH